jgi:hypothetical protein
MATAARNAIHGLVFGVILCGFAPSLAAQCGVERWSVKTGTDADIASVNLNSQTTTTISSLRGLAQPATLPANNRIAPTEDTVFVVDATLTQYKLETDSDYHLVIQDASGNTMIAEIPAPTCVGSGSPFAGQISTARSTFDGKFSVTSSFQTTSIPVRITGVGFFDFLHGQTGVAPNGIEIHPVLNIVFNPGGNPDFTLSSSNSLSIAAGSSGTSTIFAAPSGGFASTLTLSASGLPSGATASFSSTTITGGNGSSNLTVTVGSAVAAGSYTVVVTATGGGKTHTLNVPLTVTSGSTGGAELLTDGGFESATASGNTAPGWTGSSTTSGQNTIIKGGSYPHSGTNYGNMGGAASGTDTLTQTVAIPAGSAATLTFWVNIVTQETTTTTVYDKLAIQILNTSGTVLATPLTLSNLNATSSNNANGTYFQPASINLSAYAGQTVSIRFNATNDSTLTTTFRIDDISLKGSGGSGGGDTTPPTTSISTPTNGSAVSATVTVTAAASDNVGVTKMELYVDGVLAVSATSGPLNYSWNTTLIANGSHTLVSKAYDAANNVGTSSTVTVTVSNGGAQQLIGNPGFENGTTTAPWTASASVIDNSTGEAAHTGSWKAWLDGYGTTHTDTLSQQVSIPSTVTSATLTFWLHIDTAETTTTTAYDTLSVQIQNTSGTVLATLATYSNLNANTGFAQKSFNLIAYKGQTVKIVLTGTEDSTEQTSFVVDDFALNVQ